MHPSLAAPSYELETYILLVFMDAAALVVVRTDNPLPLANLMSLAKVK